MKKYALAYAMNEGLPLFTKEDLQCLTHINLAFGLVKDGLLDMSQLTNLSLIETFRAWKPEIRIVLSVGGWGAGGFSAMAMTAQGREAFARSCLEAVQRYGLDGIDIDWEYPCSGQAGIDWDPRDRENFTLLLQALRDQLGPRSLSIAAGAGEYFVRDTEMEKVARLVDYVQIMTYDMRSGFTRQAGHHAALRAGKGDGSGLNTVDMVEMFHRAGVPLEKLVIGAAFYARKWSGVEDKNHGLCQPAQTGGEGGLRYSDITESFMAQNGYAQYWDEEAQAAYLWNGSSFVSYETPEAIALKCRYVKEAGLLGIMYWEHGCDTTHELVKVIGRELGD
jgi:chitinase